MAADERLARILEVEAFLDSCRIDGANGARWQRTPEGSESPHSLYHGSAGVVLFYLELYRATGDDRFLDGVIDEARVSSLARSASWVELQYRSGRDQLVTYGAVESQLP